MAVSRREMNEIMSQPGRNNQDFVYSVYKNFDSTLRGFMGNKTRNPHDAEDLSQEVYLRFLRIKNHENIDSERAYLFTTAINLIRDKSRRLSTHLENASVSMDEVPLHCSSLDPARRAEDAEQLGLAFETLNSLNSNCRFAFLKSRIDGLSYAEIAKELAVTVSMVEKHISAALSELRLVLDA